MRGFNKAIIVGNVTRDPEVRYTANQHAVASFTVACNRSWRDQNGEFREETAFIPVVVWGKMAENCERYLKKGAPVLVEGRINTRSYETKTGEKRNVTEIVAETCQFLGGRRDDGSGASSYGNQDRGGSPYGSQDRGGPSYGNQDRGGPSYGSQDRGGYQQRQSSAPRSYRDTQSQQNSGGQGVGSFGVGGGDSFPMDISELDPASAPAPQGDEEADIPF